LKEQEKSAMATHPYSEIPTSSHKQSFLIVILDPEILKSIEEARLVSGQIDKRLALAILGKPQIYWERMCNEHKPQTKNWLLVQLLNIGIVRFPSSIYWKRNFNLFWGVLDRGRVCRQYIVLVDAKIRRTFSFHGLSRLVHSIFF
jgi:hypothetical protein